MPDFPEESQGFQKGDAQSDARGDARLAEVIDRWPKLSEAARLEILAIARRDLG
jgi:hypothetical protein